MIDREMLRKAFFEAPEHWFSIDELGQILSFEGKPSEISNELSQSLWIEHMKGGDFAHMVDHTSPMVIESPENPPVWHYLPSMTGPDFARIQSACVNRALGSELRSERQYWLGRAMEALQSLVQLEG